jgi:hypothetical protein
MHDPAGVGESDGLAHLLEGAQQPRQVGRPVGRGEFVGQGAAADELHGQERPAVGQLAQGVDRRDARVREAGGHPGLDDEPAGVLPVLHHLDRHLPVEDRVAGGVDDPHPAAGDLPGEGVPRHVRQPGPGVGEVVRAVPLDEGAGPGRGAVAGEGCAGGRCAVGRDGPCRFVGRMHERPPGIV